MDIRKILEKHITERVNAQVGQRIQTANPTEIEVRKKQSMNVARKAQIIKSTAIIQISNVEENDDKTIVLYTLQMRDIVKQGEQIYAEEYEEERKAIVQNGHVIHDVLLTPIQEVEPSEDELSFADDARNTRFVYDRRAAVRYAEQWWNDYNPKYKKFENDCTNFISQCLHAGGAPMTGYPNRGKGWWMQNNSWSYSWSVAHSLRLYLANSKSGLRAVEKRSASELMPGDVICYDFEGDGRFNHNTMVVAKDANGMPLVNAHTTNSRMRYWSYEDSTAYTPNIQYKFFHIVG
ncbi:amidase domain-containing protein [Bacillus sp. BGMRC 2118]|nr:amidase domain-containing protein [Bacillus sp. BGMRC 2118]